MTPNPDLDFLPIKNLWGWFDPDSGPNDFSWFTKSDDLEGVKN
jgi:hypothetical protein